MRALLSLSEQHNLATESTTPQDCLHVVDASCNPSSVSVTAIP